MTFYYSVLWHNKRLFLNICLGNSRMHQNTLFSCCVSSRFNKLVNQSVNYCLIIVSCVIRTKGPLCITACRRKVRDTWLSGWLLHTISEVVGCRQLLSSTRHHLTVPPRYTGWPRSGAGPFRSPVLLRGTLYQIVSVIQHWVLTVLGNYLKRRIIFRVIKHAKRSGDASWFCAV